MQKGAQKCISAKGHASKGKGKGAQARARKGEKDELDRKSLRFYFTSLALKSLQYIGNAERIVQLWGFTKLLSWSSTLIKKYKEFLYEEFLFVASGDISNPFL